MRKNAEILFSFAKKCGILLWKGGDPVTWETLEAYCNNCNRCSLGQTKLHTVFGTGNREAELLFVGEAPGEQEDRSGIPFVGAAGKLLDLYLAAVAIPREKVYIANILKCRPPHNRDPLPEEQDACMPYLREQVRLIKPKIIVCLGRIAAMRLIKPDYRITKEHGVLIRKGDFVMTAVYHPSAILHDPSKKEAMYRDMRKVRQYLSDYAGWEEL